jgi:hypothetical protein
MTWVRVDDKAVQHPKLLQVGPEGVCLWLAGLCHCNGFATDGVIRKEFVDALYPLGRGVARRVAARLVAVGLWKDEGTSFHVHDYEHYQAEAMKEVADAKAAELEARRKRDRERKRAERAGNRPRVPDLSNGTGGTGQNGHDVGRLVDGPMDVPRVRASAGAPVSRPVPTRPERDLGSAQGFGGGVAVSDDGTIAAPAAVPDGSERVSGHDAAIAWQRMLDQCCAGAGHAFSHWREDFEFIASVCNGVEGRPALALQVVTEWFWRGPTGPIVAGRIKLAKATPKLFAKGITEDLASALEWWTERKRNGHPSHEAAV